LLNAGAQRWEPPIPVHQLSTVIQHHAIKLRDALAAPLMQHAQGVKGAALDNLGRREYQRILGFEISARHFRNLFNRALERDAGEEQWDRIDLYLDERPRAVRRLKKTAATSMAIRNAEAVLLGHAAQVRDLAKPSRDEKALLWITAFEQMSNLIEQGMNLRAARQAMRRALLRSGTTLAKNETSLAQLWRIKEETWRANDGGYSALQDQRQIASGHFRAPELPQKDIDLIVGHSVKFGGRISQGWRYAVENKLLSPGILAHYASAYFASKSHVPRAIRNAVTADTRRLKSIHRGTREAKLNNGAFITRDWTGTAAGDWYQADDVTLNAYYWAPDGTSGGFTLMRGQVLLMIDVRSTCIIGFAMLDQRNYTSYSIRTLITRTCDAHGLPRRGFYFEKGIWKSSRLLKGNSNISDEELTWTESEGGLRDLGLEFRHAQLPRGKVVERVIGQIQNILDGSPGDAGRDEMKEPFERFLARKRLVESGQVHPSEYFLSWDQAEEQLAHACEEYNTARNDGHMTSGLSPLHAWRKFQGPPLARLTGRARYLLACHRKPVKVTRNGIRLQFGKKAFIYHDANTGRYQGRMVLAWFNPELPEILSVTDMKRENCFTVEASQDVDAMNAAPEVLALEMSRIDAHNSYARHRYRTIARLAGLNPRPTFMDPDSAKLGSDIAAQQEAALAERRRRQKRHRVGREALGDLGLNPRAGSDISDDQARAARELSQLLNEDSTP
jgi:hypothetical protein